MIRSGETTAAGWEEISHAHISSGNKGLVIPAQAGIQSRSLKIKHQLDPCLRRGDGLVVGFLLFCFVSFPAMAADNDPLDQILQQSPPPAAATQPPAAPDAAQQQADQHRKALLALGHEFANTIGSELQEADLYLAGAGKVDLAQHKSRTELPDNEPLIMHTTSEGGKVSFNQDIYAIKRNHHLLISLGDFCSATDIAITVHADKGTADGWFIRENQTFHLDARKHEVTIMGKTTGIKPDDIDASSPDNLLVSTELIEKWFDLTFDYDFANLVLQVSTTQPLPAEEAYLRSQKTGGKSYEEGVAKLPRMDVGYAMLSEPYVDVTTTSLWTHTPNSPDVNTNTWSAITNSDLAGFNLQTFTSGTAPSLTSTVPSQNYLQSARMTLGKQDPDGGLLGPLHATSYQMGDVSTVSLPLIGGGAQEQGVSVSNQPQDITTQTSTELRGNAQPGWDVELYRNEVFMNIAHVDVTGLYDFQNVQLVLGDNDMKLLFYGPHGEISEEHRHVLVDPTLLAQHTAYYSASASRNGINMWSPTPQTGPGVGDPNVAASVQYGLGSLGTADFGIRRHSDAGVERTFAQTGLASFLGGTYFNADIGVDAQTAATTDVITARRNFAGQSGLLQYSWNSKGYNTASDTSGATVKDTALASLSGALPGRFAYFSRSSYTVSATNTENYDGSSSLSLAPTITTRLQNLSLSGSLAYNHNTDATGNVTDTGTADFIGHGFVYGGNWRVEQKYNAIPTFQATETDLEYDHSIGEKMDTTTQLKHTNNPQLSSASFALNWRTAKATISPTISMDTTNNLTMGVNVHFGTAADPYSHTYSMYNSYLSGVGGVAARVFYDKNGDGIYDEGDELMPDVVIRAQQVHRNATTDARGVAFIPDISQNTVTDVVADASTFKDSYDISLFEGVSIRPHAGSVTQLDFPVVTGGELDGQADYVDDKGTHKPASNLKVSLVSPDGKVEKVVSAAYDGYYAISTIRPGVYYLTAETEDPDTTTGNFTPKMLVFKPEGTTLFGQGIALASGYNTQFVYTSENPAPNGARHTRVIKPEDIESQTVLLRLGQYHSRLALTFSWYRFKIRSKWGSDFALVKPLLDIEPDPKTMVMDLDIQPSQPLTVDAAANICQALQDNKFQCSV